MQGGRVYALTAETFTDVENHMLGYYRQDTSCSLKWIFQVFCQMPRKNHLDISYSRLQHNQECRSKNHLKEDRSRLSLRKLMANHYYRYLQICFWETFLPHDYRLLWFKVKFFINFSLIDRGKHFLYKSFFSNS